MLLHRGRGSFSTTLSDGPGDETLSISALGDWTGEAAASLELSGVVPGTGGMMTHTTPAMARPPKPDPLQQQA